MKRIKVVPYGCNILRYLAEELLKRFPVEGDPLGLARVTVLFPHRRPALYLKHYLWEALQGPFIPPRIYAIEDFVDLMASRVETPPKRPIEVADQAWLLWLVTRQKGTFGEVTASFDRFFPWGVRLASLFEELYRELQVPTPIPYPEGVPDKARSLLEDLGGIFNDYEAELDRRGLTTRGRRFREVASRIGEAPLGDGPMWIVGFYALTASESRILRHLWEKGAEVLWQAPPRDLPPLYRRWLSEWRAEVEEVACDDRGEQKIHFVEAYDLHSEIEKAKELVLRDPRPDSQALVLPDPAALIPVLHGIPEGIEVNVTLGYPLQRTALAALIQALMQLELQRDQEKGFYHRDYLTVIRHPFVKRFPTPSGKEGRIVLHLLEERIRELGMPYVPSQAQELLDGRDEPFLASEGISLEEARGFIRQLHERLLDPWSRVRTAAELARCLQEVIGFIVEPFTGEGQRRPLENEFLYCLQTYVIPTLEEALFRDEPVERELLFKLLERLLSSVHTPFEGQPLVGLQVLGLLETRLLSFDRVVILDVNEGVLPSYEEVDPLLPPSLRPVLGLPEREREEEIVWYHFQRLIKSASEVYLLWQSSVASEAGGLEGKATRSRFVERVLWEKEQRRQRILEEEIQRLPLHLPPSCFLAPQGITKDRGKAREFLRAASVKGLSPSLLNTYLDCPLRFYYRYILKLQPPADVLEEVDAGILGQVVHAAMEDYFRPFLKRTYHPQRDNEPDRLFQLFIAHLDASPLGKALAPERRFILEEVAKFRLKKYLEGMREPIHIEALEKEFRIELPLRGERWAFYGKVDRIDRRGDLQVVLDYKTGFIEPPGARAFVEKMAPFQLPEGLDDEGLRALKRAVGDIQLPLYVLLTTGGKGEEIERTTAAYVLLREDGREQFLLRPKELKGAVAELWVEWFLEQFPAILNYLITHILEAPLYFRATEEGLCRVCDYEPSCHFSW